MPKRCTLAAAGTSATALLWWAHISLFKYQMSREEEEAAEGQHTPDEQGGIECSPVEGRQLMGCLYEVCCDAEPLVCLLGSQVRTTLCSSITAGRASMSYRGIAQCLLSFALAPPSSSCR